jgi:hypothetical protein
MKEMLQEFVDSRGVGIRVDRTNGVIRGVKILGIVSRNGRRYLPDALTEAAGLYERAKVNVNHPKGSPAAARDYQDRIGVIRNVAVRPGEGLFGDFHFNPKHALAEQLVWDAEHAPENVGFSHNVQARTSRRGDRVVVEAITKVQSVDLVADPATTGGLFESADEGSKTGGTGAGEATPAGALEDLSAEELRRRRPDLVDCLLENRDAELAELRAEIERLQLAEALQRKHESARRLLAEFGLPDPETAENWEKSIVSDRFVESLLAAHDEEAMRGLVEERAGLVHGINRRGPAGARLGSRPLCREQSRVFEPRPADAKTFVKAIT